MHNIVVRHLSIPCDSNTAKHCELTLCMLGLKVSDLFCAFLRAVLGFLCAKTDYG